MVNIGGLLGGAGGAVVTIIIRAKDEFSKAFNKAKFSTDNLKSAILPLTAIVAGLGAVAVKSLKTFSEFESAFAGVRKTVDLTEAGFRDLEERFKTLSTEIPVSFVELSKIGELAGQLGVEGVDGLEKFTKTIADLSATTNLSAEEAATSFARIANIMEEPIMNIDRMGSAVVELGNNFATTESEIVTFATRIAGAGKIVGLNTEDIFALGAAFTSVGVQAEAGGTAVQKVLLQMNKAVIESDENLAIFAKTAGLSIDEFTELFQRDAIGAFEGFVVGLGESGDEAINILADLGLEDQRLLRAFLALAEAGDLLTRTIDSSSQGFLENTALVIEAEKRYSTFESEVAKVRNRLGLLLATIGGDLAPAIRDELLPAFDFMLMKILEVDPELREFIVKWGALTAVILGVGVAIAGVAAIVGASTLAIIAGIAAAISFLIVALTDSELAMAFFVDGLRLMLLAAVKLVEVSINATIAILLAGLKLIIEALNLIPGVDIDFHISDFFIKIPTPEFLEFGTGTKRLLAERRAEREADEEGFSSAQGDEIISLLTEQKTSSEALADLLREGINVNVEIDGEAITQNQQNMLNNQTNTA